MVFATPPPLVSEGGVYCPRVSEFIAVSCYMLKPLSHFVWLSTSILDVNCSTFWDYKLKVNAKVLVLSFEQYRPPFQYIEKTIEAISRASLEHRNFVINFDSGLIKLNPLLLVLGAMCISVSPSIEEHQDLLALFTRITSEVG